jgi:HD-GYP domain-containing protein (c-di-GMP phosphodiesterase class II)
MATAHPPANLPSALDAARSPAVQRLLSESRLRLADLPSGAELRAEALLAVAFLLAAVPLAALGGGHRGGSWPVIGLFIALYAVASRIEFDVGSGYALPTQLVLVPMLYVLSAATVPLLVAAGMIVGRLPSYANRSRHPVKMIGAFGNSWYALGPAVVFALAGLHTPRWSQWPVLVAALAAQLACDLAATVAREWLRTGEAPRLQVRLLAPVYIVDACLSPIGFVLALAAVIHPAAVLLILPLCYLLRFFAHDRQAHMRAALELSSAYRGTALLLGDVVEADDSYTGAHSRDVVGLSMAVGPILGLDENQLRHLEFTALLHDVGKIAIPKEIINKPGRLTSEERSVIETHTIEGEKMLERVGGMLGEVGRLVRSCHERYDGLGYPDGLAGEAIPIEARIVCCCDAFNAMTTDRPYRAALPLAEALGELRAHRGTQFDPAVVDILIALHGDAHAGSNVSAPPRPAAVAA